MTTRTLQRGSLTGAGAGMMMAMWSMIALAATGHGFWTPANLIAHTLWRAAPLDGTFNAGSLALGLAIHMMISMGLGVAIFAAADGLRLGRGASLFAAMMLPAAAWLAQLVILPGIDNAASVAFTPWVLAVGHVVFAMVAAVAVIITKPVYSRVASPALTHSPRTTHA